MRMNKRSHVPTPIARPLPAGATGVSARKQLVIAPLKPPSRYRSLATLFSFIAAVLLPFLGSMIPGIGPRRYGPAARARRLREHLERAGGMWVKAGQVLAMRRDLLPMEFCEELSNLHDHARGFPGSVAHAIIEKELGRPIDEVFSFLDETPLAAASIGQVHRGRLREGDIEVAVKVQRPQITDLRYVRLLVSFLKRAVPHGHWGDMMWELERTLLDELDYRMEAGLILRMRKRLLQHKNIYAPRVFSDYCTSRILVMEFVQGVFMSEYLSLQQHDPERVTEWLKENQISPRVVARHLLFSHLRQILEDNLFHCDLHPGNIMLQRNNQIVLIDFGSVGSFERSFLDRFRMNFAAIAAKDFNKIADLLLIEMPGLPHRDLNEAKLRIIQAYRGWAERVERKSLPYRERSLASSLNDIGQVYNKYRLPPAWEYMRYQRAVFTLDASFRGLSPQMNIIREMREYLRDVQRRTQSGQKPLRQDPPRPALGTLMENTYFEGEWMRRRLMKPPKITAFKRGVPILKALYDGALRLMLYGAMLIGISYLHRGSQGAVAGWGRWFVGRFGSSMRDFGLPLIAALGVVMILVLRRRNRRSELRAAIARRLLPS
jgi:ubiquinone biosynthesis protein